MVTQAEFEDAKDKVMMGAERKSLVMTEEEKQLTAYHEAGHAIVALNVPATDPVHKATIIPRGRALGMVMQLPERDKLSMTLEQMTSRLAILMGGRVAEELMFGARQRHLGRGLRHRAGDQAGARHGHALGLLRPSSARSPTARTRTRCSSAIRWRASRTSRKRRRARSTHEIRRLVEAGYAEAHRILTEKRADLETLAKGLLEFETLIGRRDQGPAQRQAAGARRSDDRAGDAALAPRCRPPARAARRVRTRRSIPQPAPQA